ncbi:hypothetical protein BC941DRAFT_426643 [Chlamydoabsidia padenii]|nr:hypothetical protein BC941DRAFT_426643 [Chlamydoabsidia padenii]
MTQTQSIQSNIITIHDAITDSPVYRASTLHFDKQLELFTQWIMDLSKQTKVYAEKLKQLNAETVALANKLNPTNIVNHHLIDSKITDIAADNFGNAIKTNLTFKLKTVSDLEDNFTQPIERFVNAHIHDFKDFRKRHQLALKVYEDILSRHAALDNNNDPTLMDDITQQLDAARKKYIEMSSEHVIRIVKLRHGLEHCLVEQYSATTNARKDFYNDAQVWKQLNTILFSWTDWLAEDKRTHQMEIQKQHLAQQTLEKEYLDGLLSKDGKSSTKATNTSKSGYLMTRSDPSATWERHWFFIHDGYFGSCKLMNSDGNPSITVDNCIPLRSCQVKSTHTKGSQCCFEIFSKQQRHQSLFILQAENEQEREEWIMAMKKVKPSISTSANMTTSSRHRPSSIILGSYDLNNDQSQPRSPALLISKSKSTTVVTTPTDIPVTLSSNTSGYSDLSILSSSPRSTLSETTAAAPLKMTWTSQDHLDLATAPSLTPLLLCEITKSGMEPTPFDDATDRWGVPRLIIPQGISYSVPTHSNYKAIQGKTVWPWSPTSFSSSVPDIPGYASHLINKNQELRSLFYGVSSQEVVMDVFIASFLRTQSSSDHQEKKTLEKSPPLGYYYSGSVYVTQSTVWFYSATSSNCITTVALKLKNIDDIQVMEDTGISLVMHDSTTLVFSVILDDVDTVVEKLRFLMHNSKLSNPMQLNNIYRKIITMSMPLPSPSSSMSTQNNPFDDLPPAQDNSPTTPSRLASSNTMDTAATLVDSPKVRTKKITLVRKPFIDPDAIPDHIEKPSGPITCDCDDHLDRRDAEMELPISAKRLYELMFSDETTAPPTDGGVWKGKTEGVQGHDLRVSRWEPLLSDNDQQDGLMKRTLKYWMPVTNPVVRMKEAEVVETQILLKKEDYLCYVVQISTKTEALPFADAFVPSVRYCITYVDDSRCKLTCYLGVRWLKWVMAKIIVTKAAMAGMSDSVHIFVPILKDAANTIQMKVDTIRQTEREASNIVEEEEEEEEDGNDDTDGVKSYDTIPTKGIHQKLTNTTITKHLEPPTQQKNDIQPPTITITPQPSKQEQPPSFPSKTVTRSTATTTTTTTTTTKSQSYSKHRSKSRKVDGLIKEKITDASGQEVPSLVKAALDSIWPPGVWSLAFIVIICLFYAIGSDVFSSNRLRQCNESVVDSQVVSHAVYLRDLDDGFIKKSLQPPYYGSESYQFFLQTRRDEQAYTWYDGRHYKFAREYEASREHLGMLRYSVVNMFQSLTIADTDLLETEYLNWLLDSRQRCREQVNETQSLCDQINNHIGTYF